MKKWMCVVGAVIGAPIVMGAMCAVAAGLVWLTTKVPEPAEWVGFVIFGSLAGLMVSIALVEIGNGLYKHCKKHWGLK